MDGCTCAYTPNKLGLREWVSGLQINKPACCAKSQLDAVFASGVQAPLKLPIGGFLSSLLSHRDMSHYSYVLAWWNAGLLWQNSAWIRKPACQKSLISYSVGVFVCVGSLNRMNVNYPFDFTSGSQSVWGEVSHCASLPFVMKHLSCSQKTFFPYMASISRSSLLQKQFLTTSRIWIHNDNGSVNRPMKAGTHQPMLNRYWSITKCMYQLLLRA